MASDMNDTASSPQGDALLSVRDLAVYFFMPREVTKAVDGVSFEIPTGSVLGIVGESGCGKTVTALSILRLVPRPGRIVAGEVSFKGADIMRASDETLRQLRGSEIAMIFQDPFSSFNPVFTIGYQVEEAMTVHALKRGRREATRRVFELLRSVDIPDPERIYASYPHTLSGGLRQRAMLAMALANEPSLLIADEPTTALDVTIQKDLLELLRRIKDERRMSVLFITHNFGIIARICDQVSVMYGGRMVESGPARDVLTNPLHPYTRALLEAVPTRGVRRLLSPGADAVGAHTTGCIYYQRCGMRKARCERDDPRSGRTAGGHTVACWGHHGD